jgi:hypothetical protein
VALSRAIQDHPVLRPCGKSHIQGLCERAQSSKSRGSWNAPGRFLVIQAGTFFNRLLGSNLFESRNSKSARSWSALRRNNLEYGAQPPPGTPPIWLGSRMVRVLLHKIYKG